MFKCTTQPQQTRAKRSTKFGLSLSIPLTFALVLTACSKTSPEQVFLESVNSQLIRPYYLNLAEETKSLSAQVEQHCRSDENSVSLKNQWRATMMAWQKAQAIQFGPLREHNLAWEYQFWPDKKNLIAKKLKPLLKTADEQTLESLKKASVVTHGLPALEYLLFDEQADKYGDHNAQCSLAQVIANHLANTSEQLNSQWLRYQTQLLSANDKNPEYPTQAHAVAVVIDSFLTQVENISNRKLTMALGLNTKVQRLNPYLLESWRSQHSKENLLANVSSVEDLMVEGGLGIYLRQKGLATLAESITQNLQKTRYAIETMPASLFEQLSQPQAPAAVSLQNHLLQLTQHFKTDIPTALNIQLGFNNNDGD
ncbi:MAG: imelysin family protein [Cellvibrionaceae bacterium]